MPKVIFEFNKEKDIENLWELCNFPNPWEDPDKLQLETSLRNRWQGKGFEESKQDISDYLSQIHNSGYPEIFSETLTKSWEKINNIYFQRLENLTQKSFSQEKVDAYISTVGRSAYNLDENCFTVSMHRQLLHALRTCGHELLHMHIEKNFSDYIIKELKNYQKFDFLNESLTVLLNQEFKDLWFMEDKGYSSHKYLRNFIEQEWKKEKNNENSLERLLDSCILKLKDI